MQKHDAAGHDLDRDRCAARQVDAVAAGGQRHPVQADAVRMRVQLEHISPTAVGGRITAEATLEKVEGRRLVFHVSAKDERGLVAAGKVTRVVVDVERFLDKAR